jgi:hypothetical protein
MATRKKKTTLNELGSMLEHVVKHMATKEDIEALAAKDEQILGHVVALHAQVNSIERHQRETKTETRLADLEEKVFGETRR